MTFRDSVNEREEQSKQLQEEMEEAKLRMEVSTVGIQVLHWVNASSKSKFILS